MSYRRESDRDLIVRLTKNDELAFKEFYFRYKERLWHYAYYFLKSEEDCDDIIQEVFIRFWEMRTFIDPDLSVSSFLYTMTKNRILNYFRDTDVAQQMKKEFALKLPAKTDTIENDLAFNEYRQILTDAINELPPQRKRIFNMSRIEHKSHKEIAARLNISVSTVQEHISESLRFIKTYFSKHTDLSLSLLIFLFV